jgi:ribosomal protein S18 acetylase RimI-like enzyme
MAQRTNDAGSGEARWVIRPARAEDAAAVSALWQVMADQHAAYDPEVWDWAPAARARWEEHAFTRFLGKQSVVLLVAEGEEGIVGFATGQVKPSHQTDATEKTGAVWDLVVDPAHRNLGIGLRLMERMLAELKARGAEDVVLHAALANEAALRLYERLGLRRVMYRLYRRL